MSSVSSVHGHFSRNVKRNLFLVENTSCLPHKTLLLYLCTCGLWDKTSSKGSCLFSHSYTAVVTLCCRNHTFFCSSPSWLAFTAALFTNVQSVPCNSPLVLLLFDQVDSVFLFIFRLIFIMHNPPNSTDVRGRELDEKGTNL